MTFCVAMKIKDGIVDYVVVGRDDDENREDELAHDGWIYRRTSYNTRGGVHYGPEIEEVARRRD